MGMFTSIRSAVDNLRDAAFEFVETRIDIIKLQAAEKISSLFAIITTYVILSLLFTFFLLFGSMAAAFALSAWLGKAYAGFLIVGGFYLVISCWIFAKRETFLRKPILDAIVRQLFKEKQEPTTNSTEDKVHTGDN